MAEAYPFNRFCSNDRYRGAINKRRRAAHPKVAIRAETSDDSIVLGLFVSWQEECTLPGYRLQRRGIEMSCRDLLTRDAFTWERAQGEFEWSVFAFICHLNARIQCQSVREA